VKDRTSRRSRASRSAHDIEARRRSRGCDRGILRRLALAAALAGALGCRHETQLHRPGAAAPERLEVRRKFDPKTHVLLREWTLLLSTERGPVKHGPEKTWYPSGALEWDRAFDHGRPAGAWRSYFEDGGRRSECFFGAPGASTLMTFWHSNGQISKQGPASNGVRTGTWRFYYPDGTLAEQGLFVENLRQGAWEVWDEDGRRLADVCYEKNVRVECAPVPSPAPGDAHRGASARDPAREQPRSTPP
jgi:hypothetical protein